MKKTLARVLDRAYLFERMAFLRRPWDLERLSDPRESYMLESAVGAPLARYLCGRIAPLLEDPVARLKLPVATLAPGEVGQLVADFLDVYERRPFHWTLGGSGFHNHFWLYVMLRALKPATVIESGVWRGNTTWLIEQAAPRARVLACDVDLSRLRRKTARATYHESDWMQVDLPQGTAGHTVAFFDCHVSHAQRIAEAQSRGIRHVLLDDDAPYDFLYRYARPPIPTASMIVHGEVPRNRAVRWTHAGTSREVRIDERSATAAAARVDYHVTFPDVGAETGFGGFSFLSYVRLR